MVHISDLRMLIRWSPDILTIIKIEMCKLKTHSPIYWIREKMDLILDTPATEYTLQSFCMAIAFG